MVSVFIGGIKAYVDNSLDLSLTKQLADIQDLGSRFTPFTYAMTFPFCPINNKIFLNLQDAHADIVATKNFTTVSSKKGFTLNTTAEIFSGNGRPVIRGFFILDSVTKNGFSGQIVFGNYLWQKEFNKNLSEVGLDYQRCLKKDFLATNDYNGDDDVICYPHIDYGNIADAVFNNSSLYVTDFLPACFIKPLLKKFWANAGYTLADGGFLDIENNQNLFLPFVNEDLILVEDDFLKNSTDVLINRDVGNTGNPSTTNSLPVLIPFIPSPLFRYIYAPFNEYTYPDAPTIVTPSNFTVGTSPNTYNATEYTIDISKYVCLAGRKLNFEIYYENEFEIITGGVTIRFQIDVGATTIFEDQQFLSDFTGTVISRQQIELKTGDVVRFSFQIIVGSATVQPTPSGVGKIVFTVLPIERYDYEGLVYRIDDNLPSITASDLLFDLQKNANLFAITDEDTKTVYLQKYDDVFANTTRAKKVNWADKCLYEAEDLQVIGYASERRHNFYHTEDDDFLNTINKNKNNGLTYLSVTAINDLAQEQDSINDIEVGASPTLVFNYDLQRWEVPALWSGDYRTPIPTTVFEMNTSWNYRILRYVPDVPCLEYRIYSEYGDGDVQLFSYGKATWANDNFPLSFENFGGNKGCYERCYKDALESSWNNKIVNLFVVINDEDFASVDFGAVYQIRVRFGNTSQLCLARLQKIDSFKPLLKEPTLCNFIIL